MNALEQFREELDSIDAQIVESLGRRFDVCRRVAQLKKEHGIPMMQPDRVEQVKQRRAALGASHGVDADFIVALYTLIIQEACRLEDKVIENEDA